MLKSMGIWRYILEHEHEHEHEREHEFEDVAPASLNTGSVSFTRTEVGVAILHSWGVVTLEPRIPNGSFTSQSHRYLHLLVNPFLLFSDHNIFSGQNLTLYLYSTLFFPSLT
jgi:hypothetical protein